jgi:hypothetical protein
VRESHVFRDLVILRNLARDIDCTPEDWLDDDDDDDDDDDAESADYLASTRLRVGEGLDAVQQAALAKLAIAVDSKRKWSYHETRAAALYDLGKFAQAID